MNQLDPKAKRYIFILTLFFFPIIAFLAAMPIALILGVISQYKTESTTIIWAIIIFGGFVVSYIFGATVFSKLTWKYFRYQLTETEFRMEYGIIFKKYISIPYDKIQNVDISRGLILRYLGLSTLQIHTAGVGGRRTGEGALPGLAKDTAEELRQKLVDYNRRR